MAVISNHAVEASRLADLLHRAALDLNSLTIELRGSEYVKIAGAAFVDAAGAAARCAELVAQMSEV